MYFIGLVYLPLKPVSAFCQFQKSAKLVCDPVCLRDTAGHYRDLGTPLNCPNTNGSNILCTVYKVQAKYGGSVQYTVYIAEYIKHSVHVTVYNIVSVQYSQCTLHSVKVIRE